MSMVAVAVLVGINSAQADDGKDFSATIGLKVWNGWWQSSTVTVPATTATEINANGTLSLIPSLTVKYKDYFMSGSYFNATNYNFSPTISAKRTETDINVGWYFVPQVAATLGYKQVLQDYTTVGVAGTSRSKYTTPTIGVSGSAKIGESGAFMYGNGVHGLSPKGTVPGVTVSKTSYASSELGFGWAFSKSLTATLGYKYQYISAYYDGVKGSDLTHGFIGGVNYTF